MTLQEACQMLAALHTRPSREHGVIVNISAPIPRGMEDRYVDAWKAIFDEAHKSPHADRDE